MVVFLGWLGYLGWKFTLDDVPMISRLMSRRFSHDFSVFQVAFVHDVTARHWHLRWCPKWAERNRIAISKEIEKLNAMLKSRMADLQLIGGIPTYPGYSPQKYEWVRLDHHPFFLEVIKVHGSSHQPENFLHLFWGFILCTWIFRRFWRGPTRFQWSRGNHPEPSIFWIWNSKNSLVVYLPLWKMMEFVSWCYYSQDMDK